MAHSHELFHLTKMSHLPTLRESVEQVKRTTQTGEHATMGHQQHTGQIVGDYRLLQRLGGGGFSNVYLAEHTRDGHQVAMKVLQTRLTNPDDWRTFLNEARTMHLHHPHIMPLLDFGLSQQEEPFLVMEYAPKGTLRDRHPKGARVPLPTILDYVTQIASALQYAHEQHLIHRDVKPENMLLRSDDMLLLSDFGMATVAYSSNALDTDVGNDMRVDGTVQYMAPEQLDGKPRPQSDQYALAVVIYEWLTGHCPFQGTAVEVAMQHMVETPPPLRGQVAGLPHEVEAVLFKALAKDPKERFASAQAMALALQQASTAPIVRKLRLLKGQSALLVVLVLLLIGTLLGGYSWTVSTSHLATPAVTSSESTATASAAITATRSAAAHSYNTYVSEHGTMFGFDAQHTHHNPYERILNVDNVSRLRQAWSISTGQTITSSPIVANGVVYVGSNDDKFYAFDATTGKQKWNISTRHYITSSPAVADDLVYIGSEALYALDATTGKQKWVFSPTGLRAIGFSPVVTNGVIYVGSFNEGSSYDGMLYAVDAITGEQKWASSPAGGWAPSSSPAVAHGLIYVGSYDGSLHAFDAVTGQSRWSAPMGDIVFSSPTVVDDLVYVGSRDGKLYAFDATTGQQKWDASTGAAIFVSSPAVANSLVYIGSNDGKLHAFDTTTGQQKWVAATGSGITSSSPIVANGLVYIGSHDSALYAFDATTGQQKWVAATSDIIDSSPAVANGWVYIGSDDHKLYAYSLP